MRVKLMEQKLEMPEGVSASFADTIVTIKGPKGEVQKALKARRINLTIDGQTVKLSVKDARKSDKTVVNTYKSHIKNMIKGVTEAFVYKLKVCSGHFPMNITASGDTFTVKNFIGEKTPRVLKLRPDVKVKVAGDDITIESINKESAGQTAADIEQMTKRVGFDRRIFQQGIYIVEKAGKEM